MGVHYPRDAATGVIVTSSPEDNVLPEEEFYQTLVLELKDEDLLVNYPLDVTRFPFSVGAKTYALAATMNYDVIVPTAFPTEGNLGVS